MASLKTDHDDQSTAESAGRRSARRRRHQAGLLAVVLSFALYVLIFVMPFLPGSAEARLVGAAVLYASSYAAFFVGGALLGPAAMARGKKRVRAFFQPPPAETPDSGPVNR